MNLYIDPPPKRKAKESACCIKVHFNLFHERANAKLIKNKIRSKLIRFGGEKDSSLNFKTNIFPQKDHTSLSKAGGGVLLPWQYQLNMEMRRQLPVLICLESTHITQ